MTDGSKVGRIVEGLIVGTEDGFPVGREVGLRVGTAVVGFFDGLLVVGFEVGAVGHKVVHCCVAELH